MNSYHVSASLRDADVSLGETDLHVLLVSITNSFGPTTLKINSEPTHSLRRKDSFRQMPNRPFASSMTGY